VIVQSLSLSTMKLPTFIMVRKHLIVMITTCGALIVLPLSLAGDEVSTFMMVKRFMLVIVTTPRPASTCPCPR
jgi:hypothetical protein